jgi:catechol 2,3-dioxygenase-like lactoylglutathione lyase family enzyme
MLGELALRVNDLPAMKAFYRDVVGFEVYNDDFDFLVFFTVGEGIPGHPQILGLFDRKVEVSQPATTLDHFAFITDDLAAVKARLEAHGVTVFPKDFPHFGWRSIFFYDPEGNTIEYVSYDPSSP